MTAVDVDGERFSFSKAVAEKLQDAIREVREADTEEPRLVPDGSSFFDRIGGLSRPDDG